MIQLDENEQEVRCQHVFESAAQRRIKAAAADSLAERPLLLPCGAGHMAVSHVEDSYDKLLSKVQAVRLSLV